MFKKILFIACIHTLTFAAQESSKKIFDKEVNDRLARLQNFKRPDLLEYFIQHLNQFGFDQMQLDLKCIVRNKLADTNLTQINTIMLMEFMGLVTTLRYYLGPQRRIDQVKKILALSDSKESALIKTILLS